MQVIRWGDSLVLRLSAAVVETLNLREGDEISIEVADPRHFRISGNPRRDEALETLRTLGWILPEASAPTATRPTRAAHDPALF